MEPFNDLPIRPRRLRQQPQLRGMLRRVALRRSDVIVPVFVREGTGIKKEVVSMPGVYQMSLDVASEYLARRAEEGFGAHLVFGIIEHGKKDAGGSAALDENNIVCQLLRRTREQKLPMAGISDLCFCEYTSHGHCGPLSIDGNTVQNDATVELLVRQAVNHAKAGAAVIAHQRHDGWDGRRLARGLDSAGFIDVSILSYSVKYASAFLRPVSRRRRSRLSSATAAGIRWILRGD